MPRLVHAIFSLYFALILCPTAYDGAGKMFELKDSIGQPLFETISISLVCGKKGLPLHALIVTY